eukprot:1270711-Lingulodinium_polyedra.AAC.1
METSPSSSRRSSATSRLPQHWWRTTGCKQHTSPWNSQLALCRSQQLLSGRPCTTASQRAGRLHST